MVDEEHTVRFRTRFEDFPGKTVLHCHKAEHEDQGMMQLVRILTQSPEAPVAIGDQGDKAADAPMPAAPAWRLPDAQGTMHELREFAGKRLVLVFFRGMGCPHCVEQLRELAERRKALDAAEVVVVAIGSDSFKPGGAIVGKEPDWPFLILADGAHEVFKQYGCYQRQPMHAVFAIDGRGQIRWRTVSVTPFTDIDRIIEVGANLP